MIYSVEDDRSESGFDFRFELKRFDSEILIYWFSVSYELVSSRIEKSVTRLAVRTSNIKFNDYKKFDIIFSCVKITSDTSHD